MTAVLLSAVALAVAGGGSASPPAPATAVGLGLREWRIAVYRPRVKTGRVRFAMTNFGEDAHNLQVTGPRGYRSRVSADVATEGGRLSMTVTLRRPGTYSLLCVKPGHLELGMKAKLTVVRRAKPKR